MKQKRFLSVFLIIALLCLTKSRAQTLKVHDIRQVETMADAEHTYTIIFTPQVTIQPHNFLLLSGMFDLGATTSYQNSTDINGASWGHYNTTNCSMSMSSTFMIKKEVSSSGSVHYLKFYNSTGFPVPLRSQITYYLIIRAFADDTLTPGVHGPVVIESVTNDQSDHYIALESNPFAGYVAIDDPSSTLNVAHTISEGESNVAGTKYKIESTLTPTISISETYRLKLAINPLMNFADNCMTVPEYSSFTIINDHTRMYRFNTSLSSGQDITITCELLNPASNITSHQLTFITYEAYSGRPVEKGSTQALTVDNLDASNVELRGFGAFGKPLDTDADIPDPLVGFFKTCSGCFYAFNSMTLKFNLMNIQLQPGNSYTLVVSADSINPSIGSLNHNFPGRMASCYLESTDIRCTGVDGLKPDTEYQISFRFYIDSNAGDNISGTVGRISLIDGNDVIFQKTPTINTTTTKVNIDFKFNDIATKQTADFRDNQLIHTFAGDAETQATSNTSYGMIYNSTATNYKLVLEYQSAATHIPDSPTTGAGTEFITTASLTAASETGITCAGSAANVDFTTNALCSISEKTVQSLTYSSIRFSPGAGWDTQYPDTPAKAAFYFSNVRLTDVSSVFLANDFNYDFFVRGTDELLSSNDAQTNFGTTQSQGLINGYAVNMKGDALSNINFGISLFWTSDPMISGSLGMLDGTKFPAVLRISGSLSNTEKDRASCIRLFFTDLDPFMEGDTTNKVACTSIDKESNCYMKQAETISDIADYPPYAWNSIDILLTSKELNSSSFQILIPVKTVAGKKNLGFALALGKSHNSTHNNTIGGDLQTSYLLLKSIRAYTPTSGDNFEGKFLISSSMEVRRSISRKSMPGQAVTTYFKVKEIPAADSNVDYEVGGAVLYCANWKFNQSSTFEVSSIPATAGDSARKTQMFSYRDKNDEIRICSYTPTYDEVPANLDVSNFTFPYARGSNMPLAYLAQSRRDGILYRYGDDGEPNQLAAANITLNKGVNVTTYPTKLIKGMKNVKLVFSFRTTYHFPKNSKIVLKSQRIGLKLPSEASCTLNGHELSATIDLPHQATFTVNAAEDFKPAEYELSLSGADIDPSARDLNNISMQIYTNDDLLIANTTQSYVLRAAVATSDTTLSIIASRYKFMIPQVRNVLEIDFKLGTDTYLSNLLLEFAIENVTDMVNSQTIYGYITNTNGQLISAVKSVQFEDPLIKVAFNSDLHTNNTLRLVIGNIESAAESKTIDIVAKRGSTKLYSSHIQGATPGSEDLLPKSSLTFAMQKEYSVSGFNAIFKLQITAPMAVTRSTGIFVMFPSEYYIPGLSQFDQFSCKIDENPVFCALDRRFMISVQSISRGVAANTQFTLTIASIQQPKVASESVEDLAIIILDNIFTPSSSNYGTLGDTASEEMPLQILKVIQTRVDSQEILTRSAKFGFIFIHPFDLVPQDDLIIFTFPNSYSFVISGLSRGTPTGRIRVQNEWSNLTNGIYQGMQIVFSLPVALANNMPYEVEIDMSTPDSAVCSSDKIQITLAPSSKNTVYGSSLPSLTNGPYPSFKASTQKKGLIWATVSTADIEIAKPLKLVSGIYSQEFYLKPVGEKLAVDMSIIIASRTDSRFKIYRTAALARRGDNAVPIRIGCEPSLTIGQYSIQLSLGAGNGHYASMPLLYVRVVSEPKTLIIPPIKLLPAALSTVFKFDFSHLLAVEDFGLTFTSADSAVIDLKNEDEDTVASADAVLNFAASNPVDSLSLNFKGSIVTPDTVHILNVVLTGNGASSLKLPSNKAKVILVPNYSSKPIAKADKVVTKGASTIIGFRSDQLSTIYYAVSRKNTVFLSCQQIMERAENHKYDANDVTGLQMGKIEVMEENRLYGRNLDNIAGNKLYEARSCAQNADNMIGELSRYDFRVGTADSQVISVEITFGNEVSAQNQVEILCFFTEFFKAPIEK